MLDVDLVRHGTATGGNLDVAPCANQLVGAGGEHAAAGPHPPCLGQSRQAGTRQTAREFGVLLTELAAVSGASVLWMTVKAVPGEEHAACLETATALPAGK